MPHATLTSPTENEHGDSPGSRSAIPWMGPTSSSTNPRPGRYSPPAISVCLS